jgi:hypothetical protein
MSTHSLPCSLSRSLSRSLLLAALASLGALAGCASSAGFQRAAGAPELPPSAQTMIVATPPAGATLLGTVVVQMNNHQLPQDCEPAALFEAKKRGATHAIVRPESSGWGKGPRCAADAYYLAPK